LHIFASHISPARVAVISLGHRRHEC